VLALFLFVNNMNTNTNYFFAKGKVSFVIDGAAGSSGKSLISSFLVKHSNKVNFLVSSFTPNASHTVIDDDGSEFVFKIFCGGSQYHEKLEAVYIADNAAIELNTLVKEMAYLKIPKHKVRISPRCAIVNQIDKDYEAGLCSLDGDYYSEDELRDGTVKTGSTCSGSGTVLAKKVVRNKTLMLAKDVPQLKDMLYDMDEIINRLEAGQSGLYEIAQGFPLSMNHHRFAPHTTSRNVTVTNALNDAMLPPKYAGNVMINWRTFPIKIHSKKYKSIETGEFLTWDEVQSGSVPYQEIQSYSGDFYPDQREMTWDEITINSGSHKKIMECTTLTKLPRRIASFSKENLREAIKFNDTGGKIYLTINFTNYVVASIYGLRDHKQMTEEQIVKLRNWYDDNIKPVLEEEQFKDVSIKYFGTGAKIEDRIRFSGLPW
jgi:adenylosuccinate synthase